MDSISTLTKELFVFLDNVDDPKLLHEERVKRGGQLYRCHVGNDVWIAAGEIMNGGLSIGNGAVIGTGAVVTKDIEPYSVVVGVPDRVIRLRFDEEVVDELQMLQWWNWSVEIVRKHYDLISAKGSDKSRMDQLRRIADSI